MKDERKKKAQLIEELEELRRRVSEMETTIAVRSDLASTILEASPTFFVAISAEGKTLMMNRAMLEALGYTEDEVPGTDYLSTFIPEYDRPTLSGVFETLVHPGEPTLNENNVLTKDGRELLVEWHGRPIFKDDGEFDFFFGVGIDITERKRAEEALRESEEKYRGLVEGMSEAVYRMSLPDGKYEYISPASKDVFGYAQEDWLGNPLLIREIIHPDFAQYFKEKWADLIEGKIPTTYEYKIIDPEGNERWILQSNRGVFDDQGNIISIEGLCRNITERKRAEEALRESEETERALLNATIDTVILIKPDGTILNMNKIGAERLGREVNEIEGLNVFDFFTPDVAERRRAVVGEVVRTGEAAHYEDERHGICFENQVCPIFGSRGKVERVAVFARDITELRRAEEELRARNLELDTFSSSISHDLQGSLTVIEGFARTAVTAKEEGREDIEKECLDGIAQAAQRMDRFIESLLGYARAGRPAGEIARVEPGEVLEELLSDMEESIHKSGIEVVIEEDLPAIRVDPLKLQQALSNLVGNAIKFIGESPQARVEIGAFREGDLVKMYVRDNGIGIPPQKQEAIFETFERLGGEKSSGLGIGLSTVKRAVEAWGGKVWVESTPGEGSTFFFTAHFAGH